MVSVRSILDKVYTIKNQKRDEKDKLKLAISEILKKPEILQKIK